MVSEELVSPVPGRRERLRPAARASHRAGPVGLVDSMLNPSAEWGQGMLDAVVQVLDQRQPRRATDRISRPQLGVHQPDRWAKAMAARHAAIVIAVGD